MDTFVLGAVISAVSVVIFLRHLGPSLHNADLRFRSAVGFIVGIYMMGSVLL